MRDDPSLAESTHAHHLESGIKTESSSSGVCDEEQANDAVDSHPASERSTNEDHTAVLQCRRPRGRDKRKRRNHTKEELSEFQSSPHYLRIPASSVSALCGLHPFQNLPQILYDLVYQSHLGQLLLQRDARALGLALVDAKTHEQEAMLNLASAASTETKELVQQVLEVSEGKRKLHSIDEVQSIQKRIKAQASKAQETGKLTKRQVESLVEASRGHVSTGFGTCHEDEALDVYERRIGCCVRERNEALMEWRFQRVCDIDGELGVTAVPMGGATRKSWEQIMRGQVPKSDDEKEEPAKTTRPVEMEDNCNEKYVDGSSKRYDPSGVNKSGANDDTGVPTSVIGDKPRPFFRIVGAVDGIRDELYLDSPKPPDLKNSATAHISNATNNNCARSVQNSSDDDEEDQWSLRPIIVECKHRMREAKVPPPLYDQIQTCLYCHMYNVEEADLIQVVRRKYKAERKENIALANDEGDENKGGIKMKGTPSIRGKCNNESKVKTTKNSSDDMKITITRVSLSDPIHNHSHHWKATLLPRLASFAEAVYNVRKDDGKRYRLLMALVQSQQEEGDDAAEEESWKVLWEECPWIRHCDTAFGKRRRF